MIDKNTFCTIGEIGKGDSGSPLISKSLRVQVGITIGGIVSGNGSVQVSLHTPKLQAIGALLMRLAVATNADFQTLVQKYFTFKLQLQLADARYICLYLSIHMPSWVIIAVLFVVAHSNQQILHGNDAARGKYSFMGQLRQSYTSLGYCGASLIAPRFFLTAAHCIVSVRPHFVVLRDEIGLKSRGYSKWKQKYRVKQAIIHPDFQINTTSFEYGTDLAVIELYNPVLEAQPVLLGNVATYEPVVSVLGWGRNDSLQPSLFPHRLQQGEYTLLHPDVCKVITKFVISHLEVNFKARLQIEFEYRFKNTLCTDNRDGETPSKGDSGSPLLLTASLDTRPVQIAVVSSSFGPYDFGEKDFPCYFAKIASSRDFIDAVVTGHQWEGEPVQLELNRRRGVWKPFLLAGSSLIAYRFIFS